MVNLTAAIGGMAIALTVDRFGHRRLVVLGTALCFAASLLGAFAGSIDLLLVWRFLEGLGFIVVTVSVPTLVLRVTEPRDRHRAMTIWTSYMPAGAGAMMLIAAVILPGTSWRAVWLVASAASLVMLLALLLRAVPRHELDAQPANRRPILHEMAEVATSGGPLAHRRSASAPIPAAGSPSWASCRPCRSSAWASRPRRPPIVTALVTAVNVGGQPLGRRGCCSAACRAPR